MSAFLVRRLHRALVTALAAFLIAASLGLATEVAAQPVAVNDGDADGVSDPFDNCPTVVNPDQADFDFDGIGDACEAVPAAGPEIVNVTDTTVQLAWMEPTGFADDDQNYYEICLYDAEDTQTSCVKTTTTGHTISDLTPSTSYSVTVLAIGPRITGFRSGLLPFTTEAATEITLTVRARGQHGVELMDVRVGALTFGPVVVTTGWLEYSYAVPSTTVPSDIRVGFTNDLYAPPIDHNLFVDYIELDGVRYESEDPSTYSTGTWAPGTGCDGGFKLSETLHCNGYFQYNAAAEGCVVPGGFATEPDLTCATSLLLPSRASLRLATVRLPSSLI